MTEMHEFDRFLTRWLEASDPGSPPEGLAERAIAEAASLPRTRVWLPALQRDFPMQSRLRVDRVPSLAWLLFVVALVAVVVGVTALGARPRPVPRPFGFASNGLLAFDVSGGLVEQLGNSADRTQIATPPGIVASPTFSPDGTHLAYWLTTGTRLSIVLADADGTDATTVPLPAAWFGNWDVISWAPTSDRIAITPTVGLAIIRVGDTAPTDLHVPGPNDDPVWSSDGSQIAYVHSTGAGADTIRMVNADGTGDHQVADSPDGMRMGGLAWQPDGSRLAFSSGAPNLHDIYTVDVRAGKPTAVSTDATDEWLPVWSPDGARLAFLRLADTGRVQGYKVVVIADPAEPRTAPVILDPIRHALVPDDAVLDARGLAWAPDGRALSAFTFRSAGHGDNQVLVFDSESGNQVVLLDAAHNVGTLSWQRTAP